MSVIVLVVEVIVKKEMVVIFELMMVVVQIEKFGKYVLKESILSLIGGFQLRIFMDREWDGGNDGVWDVDVGIFYKVLI